LHLLKILRENLIPLCVQTDVESLVFYYKMAGDYNRYLTELLTPTIPKQKLAQAASEAYHKATDLAQQLDTSHPLRLGLALNYSVFTAEVSQNLQGATKIAKVAHDLALGQENLTEDSLSLVQLLKDNISLWESTQ